jgi:hypothetical protein
VDRRSHYLDDRDHRREFVRAACLMAALARHSAGEVAESAWLLRTIEMLVHPLPIEPN